MQGNQRATPTAPLNISALLQHFQTMMGPRGLYQHATLRVPLLREGYCTDDNARAVQVLIYLKQHAVSAGYELIESLLSRCWQFIVEAEESPGVYHNFRHAEGAWLPTERSDDMYARLFRALLTVIDHDDNTERQQAATTMLEKLLPYITQLTAPRAWAEIIIAVVAATPTTQERFTLKSLIEKGSALLIDLWEKNASRDWRWFEESLTYANALFPHGLLLGSQVVIDEKITEIVDQSIRLLRQATIESDMFVPIGSNGWYPKGGKPSRDNQQPIEAGTTFDFFLDYNRLFPGKLPSSEVVAPYLWFWGHNTLGVQMAQVDGASFDGLFLKGPNKNCGAESMLAYLWSEVRLAEAPAEIAAAALNKRQKISPSQNL